MTVSVRSYLTAGAAAMVVSAIAITPVQPSTLTSIHADVVRLSAAVQPLVDEVNTVAATLGQSVPAASVQQPQAQKTAQANNNVADAINAIYQLVMPYVSYWALELGPYLLGWVPFGYLISDQLYIWYPNFTEPLTFSAVYDLLIPVVNDFWNPTVWRDGLTAVFNTARTGLSTVVQQEIAYFWSLAWFPFPLPPLPPWPVAATASAAKTTSAAAEPAAPTKASGTGHSARPQRVAKPETETPETETPVAATATDTTVSTTSASKTATSGKSGSAKSSGATGKKNGTGSSARTHGPNADKAAKAAK